MKNSFSINIVFLLLGIVGFALIPYLSIQLQPTRKENSLSISYSWKQVPAEALEREVTSRLEGILSTIAGLQQITSSSSKGTGNITLHFSDKVNLEAVRFETNSLLRDVYRKLPEGVSRPKVGGGSHTSNSELLLVYSLHGAGSEIALKKYAEKHIVPSLALIKSVSEVSVSGANRLEWELQYNKEELSILGLSTQEISIAIQKYLQSEELGGGSYTSESRTEYLFVSVKGQKKDAIDWNKVIIANKNGRLILLKDVVNIVLKEEKPDSYFRINGLNTVSLRIKSSESVNQIKVAEEVEKEIKQLQISFPESFSLLKKYDAAENLEKEINKILMRSGLAIVVLLVFVLYVSRQWRYLLLITSSLFVNVLIAVIFFYWFKIEIHIYSLAGLTVSMGIIIDNTVVMVDHIRYHRNMRVFLAILAATLTTMGALSIVFFLKEHQQTNLIDFTWVMLINLGVSLLVSLFFIPAMMQKISLEQPRLKKQIGQLRLALHFSRIYNRLIIFQYKKKWIFILFAMWSFGIPFYLLPDKLAGDSISGELRVYEQVYNKTLGNPVFVRDIKPWVNKIIGGSLYYFSSYLSEIKVQKDTQRSKLIVDVSMPDGATLEQMNKLFLELEAFLSRFDEIERFVSEVRSPDKSTIEISFKEECEESTFPFQLKQLIVNKALQMGGVNFVISGIGKGFNNIMNERTHNSTITLTGYNYNELIRYARLFKDKLLEHERIKEVLILNDNLWQRKNRYEFVADFDMEELAYAGSTAGNLFRELSHVAIAENTVGNVIYDNDFIPVILREQDNSEASIWHLKNEVLEMPSSHTLRFNNIVNLRKEHVGLAINKENQEYQLFVNYNFIGTPKLASRVLKDKLGEFNNFLPLGYQATDKWKGYHWYYGESTQYSLLLLVILIIYFICAILLESFLQPLAVIAIIPISFIGIFLTFAISKTFFDQGGYASMVLLCGLTVNSALYIINDFNNYQKRGRKVLLKNYIKAFNHKIIPILLTILSTSVGFLPFIIYGKNEEFWYSLAMGTIGGLFFSLIAVVVWLPLFMRLLPSQNMMKSNCN